MNIQKARRAVQFLAQREGVSEQHILEEINKAISLGIEAAQERGDEKALEQWGKIAPGQTYPDAYTLIACLADRAQAELPCAYPRHLSFPHRTAPFASIAQNDKRKPK